MRDRRRALRIGWTGCLAILAAAVSCAAAAPPEEDSRVRLTRCDRELRKTFEALQAWRRGHAGAYPGKLAQVVNAGLAPAGEMTCPSVRWEEEQASGVHPLASSRGRGGDPAGLYEYELSDTLEKFESEKPWLPDGLPPYTRQDVKRVLLGRPLAEQVPVLRCFSHKSLAPDVFREEEVATRNLTVVGQVYWAGKYWEQNWLDQVPYCARETMVLFGLEGPPFSGGRVPEVAGAVDISRWACAFADVPWWWTVPYFEHGTHRQGTPHLGAFVGAVHGAKVMAGGEPWWVDGLVQLQGRCGGGESNMYREPGVRAFVWEKRGLAIGRRFSEAAWLQGTVWTNAVGTEVGAMVWKYADGGTARVPIVYGIDTARFWGDPGQVGRETGFPEPVWKTRETATAVGRERWIRVYRQQWRNPRPEAEVASVDFESVRTSPGAPFLLALKLKP